MSAAMDFNSFRIRCFLQVLDSNKRSTHADTHTHTQHTHTPHTHTHTHTTHTHTPHTHTHTLRAKRTMTKDVTLVAHDCGYPLSRYTCRATRVATDFLDFIAFCRCSTGVALYPLKILVWHLPPLCREVSHRNLGLKRCRAIWGCRSYSCGCRATLCN